MTKEKVWRWATELRALMQQREQLEVAVADASAAFALASERGNTTAMESIRKSRDEAKATLDDAIVLVERRTGVPLQRSEELLMALETRLRLYNQVQRELTEMEAQFEMAVKLGEFDAPEGMTRAQAEATISNERTRLETQLALAEALIPATSDIIITKPPLVMATR